MHGGVVIGGWKLEVGSDTASWNLERDGRWLMGHGGMVGGGSMGLLKIGGLVRWR